MGSSLYWQAAFHKAIATAGCFLPIARAPKIKSRLTLSVPVSQKVRLIRSQSFPSSCTSAHQWKSPGLYKVYANNQALTLMSSPGNSSLSQTQSWSVWSLVWLDGKQKAADSNYHHSSFFFSLWKSDFMVTCTLHYFVFSLPLKPFFKLVQEH